MFKKTVSEIAASLNIAYEGDKGDLALKGFAALLTAKRGDISFCEKQEFIDDLKLTRASLCLVNARFAPHVPTNTVALIVSNPYRAYVQLSRELQKQALKPQNYFNNLNHFEGATIHPTAEIEHDVIIDPGAVIGANVQIGSGTVIGPATIIAQNVTIGRDCTIEAHVTLQNANIGNNVIIHSGVRIGQDGFGYHFQEGQHLKVPQMGRVLIQDNVEIGANTTIDCGAIKNTIIGSGTKIDNLVQIGHNVRIGRHCILVSMVALAGSSTLEDYVVLGGKVVVNNNAYVGEGAQVAALSAVRGVLAAGGTYGGQPAKPIRLYLREVFMLEKMARKALMNKNEGNDE